MAILIGAIFGIVIGLFIFGFIIWVVSKLGLGLHVDNFLSAIIAGGVIAILTHLINLLLAAIGIGTGVGIIGAIVSLIIAAIVLLLSDRLLRGLRVDGFTGALVAAVAIAVIRFLLDWVAGLFV
jgi:putative membrane protein